MKLVAFAAKKISVTIKSRVNLEVIGLDAEICMIICKNGCLKYQNGEFFPEENNTATRKKAIKPCHLPLGWCPIFWMQRPFNFDDNVTSCEA